MTIIFDFDYTLFDTARFKEALLGVVSACGPSRERWLETYQDVVGRNGASYDYDPDLQIEFLAKELTCSRDEVHRRLDETAARSGEFLYPGAAEFLRRLKGRGHRLVLLTLGNPGWQELKIRAAGLEKIFDRITTVAGDKTEVLSALASPGEPAVVINDNGLEIARMMAAVPAFKYILKRGPKPTPPGLGVVTADSFEEIERIIDGYAPHP